MFVMLFAFGWLVHGGLLKSEYAGLASLLRPMDETRSKILYIFGGQICAAAAFTWICLQGRADKPWFMQGVRYGIAIALLSTVLINLIHHATMPLPLDFMLKRMAYDAATVVLMGITVAFINRKVPSRHG
jgi:hypothetical protein